MTAGGAIRAARASAPMRASVETTVSCSVVVPTRVIATGVSGAAAGRDQRGGDVGDRADRGEQHQGAVVGVLRPVDLRSAQVTTATSRCFLSVSGTPAYAGTAVTEETPGTISKPTPALTQACASSGPEA